MGTRYLPFHFPEDDDGKLIVVVPGMLEWVSILKILESGKFGLKRVRHRRGRSLLLVRDARLFLGELRGAHERRQARLPARQDGRGIRPVISALSVESMSDGDRLPFQPDDKDPSTRWSADTEPFNDELEELGAGDDC